MSIVTADPKVSHKRLQEFRDRWNIDALGAMELDDYTQVNNSDTFTYWLEHGSEDIGRMGGGTSSKFGIWNRASDSEGISPKFLYTNEYKWFKKYGSNQQIAFDKIKSHILSIVSNSQLGNFEAIDEIDIDSMTKWKIAFIYSDYGLMPIYKQDIIRTIAKHFDHTNYAKAKLSELHRFILAQKSVNDDFFDFSSRYFQIATVPVDRNYYIIGSKYGDGNGNDIVDVFPDMLAKNAISTGFFWSYDLTPIVGEDHHKIQQYLTKNVPSTEEKYWTSIRTFKYFLNLKKGDLIAVKSHGNFGNLTVIAYAEVREVNGSVYVFGDDDLGHLIHVDFLETGLNIKTGLNYAATIHKIVPGEKAGHFEKIFGGYSIAFRTEEFLEDEVYNDDDPLEGSNDELNDIREKDTSTYIRTGTVTQVVRQVHNTIQNAFARYLEEKYPNDRVKTERQRIDIWRKSDTGFYIYEVKPYHTAYACIREALGQLTDYAFSKASSRITYLIVVGIAKPSQWEMKYIRFLKENLGLHFSYEYYDINANLSVSYPLD